MLVASPDRPVPTFQGMLSAWMERQNITRRGVSQIAQRPLQEVDEWLAGKTNPPSKSFGNLKKAYNGFFNCRFLTDEELAKNNEDDRKRKEAAKGSAQDTEIFLAALTPVEAPKSAPTETLNEGIVRLRKENKISRQTLADILSSGGEKVSESTIIRWESGGSIAAAQRDQLIQLWPELEHLPYTAPKKSPPPPPSPDSATNLSNLFISEAEWRRRRSDCAQLLYSYLKRGERIPVAEVRQVAKNRNYGERPLDDVRSALKLKLERVGFGKEMVGYWIPTEETPTDDDLQRVLTGQAFTFRGKFPNGLPSAEPHAPVASVSAPDESPTPLDDSYREEESVSDQKEQDAERTTTGKPALAAGSITRYLANAAKRTPYRLPQHIAVKRKVTSVKSGHGVLTVDTQRYILNQAITHFQDRMIKLAPNAPTFDIEQSAAQLDKMITHSIELMTFEQMDFQGEVVKVVAFPSVAPFKIHLAIVRDNKHKSEMNADEEITAIVDVTTAIPKFDPKIQINQPFRALAGILANPNGSNGTAKPVVSQQQIVEFFGQAAKAKKEDPPPQATWSPPPQVIAERVVAIAPKKPEVSAPVAATDKRKLFANVTSDNPAEIGAALGLALRERKARLENLKVIEEQRDLAQCAVNDIEEEVKFLKQRLTEVTE
jgi:transcriptional regulator with XRE-family HTH domain